MESCILNYRAFYPFLSRVLEEFPVMGPMERRNQPGFFSFDYLNRAEDFVPHYVTTTIPPKKAYFQPSETLFTFTEGRPPELKLVSDIVPFVLAGVHPCDLAALAALDRAFDHPPPEARWAADRKLATVIGVDCLPDEYCFCSSLGTINSREACDLFLTPVDRKLLKHGPPKKTRNDPGVDSMTVPRRPTVAFFDFACCEGCQLTVLELDEKLLTLLDHVEVVAWREAMTGEAKKCDIAFCEGSIVRQQDIDRIKRIRSNAGILASLGACASIGCHNARKNQLSSRELLDLVYGLHIELDSIPARPVTAVKDVLKLRHPLA